MRSKTTRDLDRTWRRSASFTLFGPADYFNNRQLAIIEEQLQP